MVMGIIGSGKTTLCKELAAELGAEVLTEKAQEDGVALLDAFYEDPLRNAFLVQINQLVTRAAQYGKAQGSVLCGGPSQVLDGGFWLDSCYAAIQAESGTMRPDEYLVYLKTFHFLAQSVLRPTFVVQIHTSPSVARERVLERAAEHPERGREVEGVTVPYLTALDNKITALSHSLQAMGTPVERVFWDEDRKAEKQRRQAVEGLARMIRGHVPTDPLQPVWQRRLG